MRRAWLERVAIGGLAVCGAGGLVLPSERTGTGLANDVAAVMMVGGLAVGGVSIVALVVLQWKDGRAADRPPEATPAREKEGK